MWTWQSQAPDGMSEFSFAIAEASGSAAARPEPVILPKVRLDITGTALLLRDEQFQRQRRKRGGNHDRRHGAEPDDIGAGEFPEPAHHRRPDKSADGAHAVDESETACGGDAGQEPGRDGPEDRARGGDADQSQAEADHRDRQRIERDRRQQSQAPKQAGNRQVEYALALM